MAEKTLMDHERAHTGKASSFVRHGQNASSSNIRKRLVEAENVVPDISETRYHKLRNQLDFD